MHHDEYVQLTRSQYWFIVAASLLGTFGVMGWCQMPFDIILGFLNIILMIIGIRGLHKKKKLFLRLFLWGMIAIAFLHIVNLAVIIIVDHKYKKHSRFGFAPDIIIVVIRIVYSLALSFFTGFIKNTIDYKKPPSQLNRI
ncbi:hypothetical protein CYY_005770 [Polysphondylium violaceum]|uniref:Transmembrane protein n=1 Tax=Polysphondylium violaceum TaxID=133409 RepID=A0A8J4UZF1_9MYCE|nr:hypothetical protein CYY_005770 [Polysphondylium violaceum]